MKFLFLFLWFGVILCLPPRAWPDAIVDNFDDQNLTAECWGQTENNWVVGVDGQEGLGLRAANDTPAGLYLSGKDAGLIASGEGYAYQMRASIAPYTALDPAHQIHLLWLGVSRQSDFDASQEAYLRFTAWYASPPSASSVQNASFSLCLMGAARTCGLFTLCSNFSRIGPWDDSGTTITSVQTLDGRSLSTTPQVFYIPLRNPQTFKIDPVFRFFSGGGCCTPADNLDLHRVQMLFLGLRRASTPSGGQQTLGANFAIDDILFIRRLPEYLISAPTRTLLGERDAGTTACLTVSLASAPSHPVTLVAQSQRPERLMVWPDRITFLPPSATNPSDLGSWMTSPKISVQALDDGIDAEDEIVTVTLRQDISPVSLDLAYSRLSIPPLTFTIRNGALPPDTPIPTPSPSTTPFFTSTPSATSTEPPTSTPPPMPSATPFYSPSPTPSPTHAQPVRSSLYPLDWVPSFEDREGRFLPDFSYAGYCRGERPFHPPPNLPIMDARKEFHADDTGTSDSTQNIQQAINAASQSGGIVYIPAGLYRCDGLLRIQSSRVILRGDGPDKSRMYFTKVAGMTGQSHLQFSGSVKSGPLLPLLEDGANRSTSVRVGLEDAASLQPGDDIAVGWTITEAFIAEHGMTRTWTSFTNQWKPVFLRNIQSIDASSTSALIHLDAPLRYPVKVRDQAGVRKQTGYLEFCGIEEIALSNAVEIQAARNEFRQHLLEFSGLKDSFAYRVHSFPSPLPEAGGAHLQNCGFYLLNSKRMTVDQCRLQDAQNLQGGGCGYLFEISKSNEILLRDCQGARGRHNFIQNWDFGTAGCVFLRCHSRESHTLEIIFGVPVTSPAYPEYHHSLAMACLVDSCTLLDGWIGGNRGAESSGAGHTVTQSVYWNLRGPGRLVSYQYGNGYIIGTRDIDLHTSLTDEQFTGYASGTSPEDFTEAIGRAEDLHPPSLYEDQLRRRTGVNPWDFWILY